jgi:phosphate transport system protein
VAIKTMATDLERVGDLARNIAKCAARLCERDPIAIPAGLEALAANSRRMLRRSLDAFCQGDSVEARNIVQDDDKLDDEEDRFIRDAIEEIRRRPEILEQELDLILIAKHLERVGDHATNIAEDVVLLMDAKNLKHAAKLKTP